VFLVWKEISGHWWSKSVPYSIEEVSGNLVKFDADFIVNASNTKLILGSGVSMAFKRHCGIELQQEMDKIIKNSKIQQGDVVATSSGRATNFQYALHAAVINYQNGLNQQDRKPRLDIIWNILLNIEPYLDWHSKKFSNKKIILVIPYIGCGVGGLNKKDVKNLFLDFVARNVDYDCLVKICGI
jgi:O-acetyl-ADP-ribose deacetylase